MSRIKVLAFVVVVMAIALVGCDKAKSPFLAGEQFRLAGQFDLAIAAYDEAINVNPTSEFAAKAKVSKALSLYGKGEKLEKDGKYAEMIEPLKKWVEMDPEKDLGKGPKAKVVYKAENAINELIKGSETPEKRDTVRKLVDVITTYDDSQYKKSFWAAFFAAEGKNVGLMKTHMAAAKKVAPPAPAVPYSTIWSLMELAAKLDDIAHSGDHHAAGKEEDKKDEPKKDEPKGKDKGKAKPPTKAGKGGKSGGKPPKKAKK